MASLITWVMSDGSWVYQFVTFNARIFILYPFIFLLALPFFLLLKITPSLGIGRFQISKNDTGDEVGLMKPTKGTKETLDGIIETILGDFLSFAALFVNFVPAVRLGENWVHKVLDGLAADVKEVGPLQTALHLLSLIEYGWETVFRYVDDRKLRQEDLLVWCSQLPPDTENSTFRPLLEYAIVSSLWGALPHPVGNWAHYALGGEYRKADGSHNNLSIPDIGKSHGRLIRDVTSPNHDAKDPAPQTEMFDGKAPLPSAKEVFHKILKRREFRPHPSGISANFFYNATLITHDLFNSKSSAQSQNKTTSYADLSWLYGWTSNMQKHVRWNKWVEDLKDKEYDAKVYETREQFQTFMDDVSYLPENLPQNLRDWVLDKRNKDKSLKDVPEGEAIQAWVLQNKAFRGKLYPDVFADRRLILQPPGLVSYALLWARNHNWIAEQLLVKAKDDPRFASNPSTNPPTTIAGWEKLDEDLFQVARNINILTFVTVIMRDYVRTILALNKGDSTWTVPITGDFSWMPKDIPQATGNQCSIEFNFIYRWHSAISQADAKWADDAIEGLMRKPGVPDSKALSDNLHRTHRDREDKDPRERDYFLPNYWTKHDPRRLKKTPLADPDKVGLYPDEDLAKFLKASTDAPAGAFGGTQVPAIFEPIEIMGIEHGRKIGVCTLNEYRKFLGLRPFKTFEEMNPRLAADLKVLYKHPDNVELYPGIVAEDSKPSGLGAGLCAGYTATFAILSDAIALVRGDRFLTMDANPYNVTNWGLEETQADLNSYFGNVLGTKLLNRHLPNQYPLDSIYTQFMFLTPAESKANLVKAGKAAEYRETWSGTGAQVADDWQQPIMSKAEEAMFDVKSVFRSVAAPNGARTAAA